MRSLWWGRKMDSSWGDSGWRCVITLDTHSVTLNIPVESWGASNIHISLSIKVPRPLSLHSHRRPALKTSPNVRSRASSIVRFWILFLSPRWTAIWLNTVPLRFRIKGFGRNAYFMMSFCSQNWCVKKSEQRSCRIKRGNIARPRPMARWSLSVWWVSSFGLARFWLWLIYGRGIRRSYIYILRRNWRDKPFIRVWRAWWRLKWTACYVNTKRTMEFLHLSIHDYIPEASNYDAGSRVIVNQHHSQNHCYTPAVALIKGWYLLPKALLFCVRFGGGQLHMSYVSFLTSQTLLCKNKRLSNVVLFLIWMSGSLLPYHVSLRRVFCPLLAWNQSANIWPSS